MSKDNNKPKVPYTRQLRSAQEDLLRHREQVSLHASHFKRSLHSKMASKGMLGVAAGTGFLIADLTRPSPVVVEEPVGEPESGRDQKRKRSKKDASKERQSGKTGMQKADELLRMSMHLMAWFRTFQTLANTPGQQPEKQPDQTQPEQ